MEEPSLISEQRPLHHINKPLYGQKTTRQQVVGRDLQLMSQKCGIGGNFQGSLFSRSAEDGAGVVLSTAEDDRQVTHMKSKPPLL